MTFTPSTAPTDVGASLSLLQCHTTAHRLLKQFPVLKEAISVLEADTAPVLAGLDDLQSTAQQLQRSLKFLVLNAKPKQQGKKTVNPHKQLLWLLGGSRVLHLTVAFQGKFTVCESERQRFLDILGAPLTQDMFDLFEGVTFTFPYKKVWPILDNALTILEKDLEEQVMTPAEATEASEEAVDDATQASGYLAFNVYDANQWAQFLCKHARRLQQANPDDIGVTQLVTVLDEIQGRFEAMINHTLDTQLPASNQLLRDVQSTLHNLKRGIRTLNLFTRSGEPLSSTLVDGLKDYCHRAEAQLSQLDAKRIWETNCPIERLSLIIGVENTVKLFLALGETFVVCDETKPNIEEVLGRRLTFEFYNAFRGVTLRLGCSEATEEEVADATQTAD